jgi:hypothetical protein
MEEGGRGGEEREEGREVCKIKLHLEQSFNPGALFHVVYVYFIMINKSKIKLG